MKIPRLFFSFLFVFISAASFAQTTEPPGQPDQPAQSKPPKEPQIPFKDRLFIGGNFGLIFGPITNIEIAPQVGYRITDAWSAGVGIRYAYFSENDIYYQYKTNIYGGLLFTRYIVYKGLFVDAELEANNFDVPKVIDPVVGSYIITRQWIPSLLLGGGYAQEIGDRSVFFVSVLYDVLQNRYSPYGQTPVIRAGFGLGL